MGRRNRREPQSEPAEIRVAGMRRVEDHPDGQWAVQKLTGASATKAYQCPGCNQQIPSGVAHIVAWPFYGRDIEECIDERRHWHNICWQKRLNRR